MRLKRNLEAQTTETIHHKTSWLRVCPPWVSRRSFSGAFCGRARETRSAKKQQSGLSHSDPSRTRARTTPLPQQRELPKPQTPTEAQNNSNPL